MAWRKQNAFTLIEMLVVVTIIALLVGMLTPTVRNALKQAQKVACQNHLREIARACSLYAQDNRLHRGTERLTLPSVAPETDDKNGKAWYRNDTGNLACLWLLNEHDYATPDVFVCPAGDHDPAGDNDGQFNVGGKNCDYSYLSMVLDDAGKPILPLSALDIDARMVILADKSPRFDPGSPGIIAGTLRKNSLNHGGKSVGAGPGQNIGHFDCSVEWTTTSMVVTGSNTADWIYHCHSNDDTDDRYGQATGADDVFLIP